MRTLEGTAFGYKQQDLIDQATQASVLFFGTECVEIKIIRVQANTEIIAGGLGGGFLRVDHTFTADWSSGVEHDWRTTDGLRPKCSRCGIATN